MEDDIPDRRGDEGGEPNRWRDGETETDETQTRVRATIMARHGGREAVQTSIALRSRQRYHFDKSCGQRAGN